MSILGISAFYHDSAACLVQDDKIIAVAQEERFTRKKHDASSPKNAVEFSLKQGGINTSDLDYVGFYDKLLQVVFFGCFSAGDPVISGAQLLPLGYQRAYVPIIGFFGGGGISFLLQQWINPLKFNEAGKKFLAIAIVVITLDILSSKISVRVQ
jgi:hypothetical protein